MEDPILSSENFFTALSFSPPPPPPPEEPNLIILRQNSLTVERVSQNGLQKSVHVVVKNQPFLMQVGLAPNVRFDFAAAPLEARLLYDCDNLKEVDFVKLKPLEYRCHVNERGDQVTMELRLKVLSSQLEDMFFRLKFIAVDNETKERIENFSVISEPIKVVSKPEQAKRKKVVALPTLVKEKKDKKDKNEVLSDKLRHMEITVLQQQNLLAELYKQSEFQKAQSSQLIQQLQLENMKAEKRANEAHWEVIQCKKQKQEPSTSAAFEEAFNTFMQAYDRLNVDERSEKIRRAMRNIGSRDNDTVCEMLDLFACEGVQRATSCSSSEGRPHNSTGGRSTCDCLDCPFEKEVQRIDEFYNDFLCNPDSLV